MGRKRKAKKALSRIPVEPMPLPPTLGRKLFMFFFKWRIISRLFLRSLKEKDTIKWWIIAALYPAGVTVGIAAYTPPVPVEFFYLAYALVAAGSILLVAKVCAVARTRALLIAGQLLALSLSTFLFVELYRIQLGRDLSSLKGTLVPASDTVDRSDLCGLSQKDLLVAKLGSYFTAVSPSPRLNVISGDKEIEGGGHDLLFLERNSNGTVTVNLHALDKDGNVILDIDKNTFEINRNKIIDSLSPPRPDKSTIIIRDERGSNLKIRMANRNTISFTGKFYFGRGYIDFRDNGVFSGPPDRLASVGYCLVKTSPIGAVIHITGEQ